MPVSCDRSVLAAGVYELAADAVDRLILPHQPGSARGVLGARLRGKHDRLHAPRFPVRLHLGAFDVHVDVGRVDLNLFVDDTRHRLAGRAGECHLACVHVVAHRRGRRLRGSFAHPCRADERGFLYLTQTALERRIERARRHRPLHRRIAARLEILDALRKRRGRQTLSRLSACHERVRRHFLGKLSFGGRQIEYDVIPRIQRRERRAVRRHRDVDVVGVKDALRCVLLCCNPQRASAGDGRALQEIGVLVVRQVDDIA